MPTRKELIDQVRADQRERSARTRADNPKSAIVGIGDRDPLTGQYQVLLPDGSVEMGEKQFNSSLPKGNQVLGIPQSTGGWLLDERDVRPINPTIQPSPMGKIKVMFSTIEGSDRVFWVGGDRPTPRRIYAIPANRSVAAALISNAGEGDLFFASLSHLAGNGLDSQKITISSSKKMQVVSSDVYPAGHGFWTQALGTSFIGVPVVSTAFDLVSHSQFLGESRTITGGRVSVDGIDSGFPRIGSGSSNNAISPKIDKLTKSFISIGGSNLISRRIASYEIRKALILGKKAASVIYESIDYKYDEVTYLEPAAPPPVITRSYTNDTILVDCVTQKEIKLGGDLGFRSLFSNVFTFEWVYPIKLMNLIRRRLYVVNFSVAITEDFDSSLNIPSALWKITESKNLQIDIYDLGANTTKRSSSAKVYALKPNARVHSVSYHP